MSVSKWYTTIYKGQSVPLFTDWPFLRTKEGGNAVKLFTTLFYRRPSFFEGMARLFDLRNTLGCRRRNLPSNVVDYLALGGS